MRQRRIASARSKRGESECRRTPAGAEAKRTASPSNGQALGSRGAMPRETAWGSVARLIWPPGQTGEAILTVSGGCHIIPTEA